MPRLPSRPGRSGDAWRVLVLATLAVGLVWAVPSAASAHQPRPTLVTVSTGSAATRPTLQLVAEMPLDKLRLAYGVRITDDPARAVVDQAATIADLVAARVTLTSAGGDWTVRVDSVEPSRLEGRDTAKVHLTATPPPGPAPTRVDLRWEVITDVVFTHKVYVAGVDAEGISQLVGLVTAQQATVPLEVDRPAIAQTSRTMLTVGFGHFREGIDHQLFLCLVALAALRPRARRARLAGTARRLAVLTAMFTLGHSVSLALASSGLVVLPSRWVETGIAVTILLAAVHALRPVVPARGELAITGVFGLVHGFGFAGTLAELSLQGRALVVPVLTFNVGLEAAQLVALALVVVPILLIARSTGASALVAGGVGIVAASWIIQRAVAVDNPLDTLLAGTLTSPERLAALLAVVAAGVVLTRSRTAALLPSDDGARIPQPVSGS